MPAAREAPLVLDAPAGDALPRHFRSTRGLDGPGLADLRMSGSAQFSALGLGSILAHAGAPLTVVDLRREPHGFVDGAAVSWYGPDNALNAKLSYEAALEDERRRLAALGAAGEALIGTKESALAGTGAGVREVVGEASTEEALVRAAGASYVRLAVSDHSPPSSEDVDRFLAALAAVAPGSWVHFHCRGGKGRTTTFMILHDLVRNAPLLPAEAIAARQSALAGGYDVFELPDAEHPYAALRRARADLVRSFHAFALARAYGSAVSYGEWLRLRDVTSPRGPSS